MLPQGIIGHKVQPVNCTKQKYEWFGEEQWKSKSYTLRRSRECGAGFWSYHLCGPRAGECDFNPGANVCE